MNSLQSSLYTAALALCLFSTGLLGGRKNRTGPFYTRLLPFSNRHIGFNPSN